MESKVSTASKAGVLPGEGYKHLIVWQNAEKLRYLVYGITGRFKPIEFRRVTQLRDAVRSVKQNIQEGYKSGSAGKFVQYLNIAIGSLGEAKGDIDDSFQDLLISQDEFSSLEKLCVTTDFLLKKMIKSIREAQQNGTWKNFNG